MTVSIDFHCVWLWHVISHEFHNYFEVQKIHSPVKAVSSSSFYENESTNFSLNWNINVFLYTQYKTFLQYLPLQEVETIMNYVEIL